MNGTQGSGGRDREDDPADPAESVRSGHPLDLAEVARRLGVHYMTAYRYVRLGRLPAAHRGGRWWVDPADVDRFVAQRTAAPPARRGDWRPEAYRTRLGERMLEGDEAGAWSVVESALVSGVAPKEVILGVLAPAMRALGDGWEEGRHTVAEEHRASTVALRLVGRLGPLFARRGRPRGTVVLAAVAGDPHSLPTAMVADVLRGEGYALVDLGADTPVRSVVEAVGRTPRPLALGLSAGADQHLAAVRRTVGAVRAERPDLPIYVGGPAVVSADQASDLGAEGWAADAGGFADLLEGLTP
ncbi:cobalamin-dependent protein [Actinopolymorpha singaporensis]